MDNAGGNPAAARALSGLSLAALVDVCDGLRAGHLLAELVVDVRDDVMLCV